MSYVALGAPTPAQAALVGQVLESLPSCFSDKMYVCWNKCEPDDVGCQDASGFPNCRHLMAAWKADKATMEKAIDDLPICPAPPSKYRPVVIGVASFVAGLALGAVLTR